MADGDAASGHPLPAADFVALAAEWCEGQSALLLGFVWQAYDALTAAMPRVDRADMERSITQVLEPRIHQAMTGDETFYVQHGPYERETKMPPPAQPPCYDIAFVLHSDQRIMWPLEAKVLKTDGNVRAYVADVRDQFLSCRYAPFSSEAAMLGYVLSGDPDVAFRNIASRVPCRMEAHPSFLNRPHRVSKHTRRPPSGKSYPSRFACHHLLLEFPSLSEQGELPLQ
jgi:hypothetical protein